jgi:2-C-methyl-D-erythritol 4-phosphate cytidylyltransferase/2-C-methyl-D-erythritol 2,4-cyclodiphosphate synthase
MVGGKPVIVHTLENFMTWGPAKQIVVVIHPDDEALFARASRHIISATPIETVHGGATRQQSVLAGLRHLKNKGISHVLIHDAVRPFFDHRLLDRIADTLLAGAPAALPAVPVADTLKRAGSDGKVVKTVSRDQLYAAQTPQSFHFATILDAHEKAAASGRTDFTDDASIAEWLGIPVTIVEGASANVKLTVRSDIAMADDKLSGTRIPDVRTGNGYDVHQLEPGDGVTLCGVFIPHDQKLKGHSDADVALHALTDALLATCGAGDIGDHFPPSDPQWRGADSALFLRHAMQLLAARGGLIANVDITIVAEAPKIAPHVAAMRERLSTILGIKQDRIGIKATTSEKLGFTGRREGLVAMATATVRLPWET